MNKIYIIIVIAIILILIYNKICYDSYLNIENFQDLNYNYQILIEIINKFNNITQTQKIKYWSVGDTFTVLNNSFKIEFLRRLFNNNNVSIGMFESDFNKFSSMGKSYFETVGLEMVETNWGYTIFKQNFNYSSYPHLDIYIYKIENDKVVLKNKSFSSQFVPNEFSLYSIFNIQEVKLDNFSLYTPSDKPSIFVPPINSKPFLWQYWDNPDNTLETPAYINLCFKSVDKYCSDSFSIQRLNKYNIYNYLPELKEYKNKLDKLIIAQRVDIYRIYLLYKYGGLYMDADTICLRNPIEIIEKTNKFDFVGFGCTGLKCTKGYKRPSNGIMASRPKGILISKTLETLLIKIQKEDKFDYFDLGKLVLWSEIDKLGKKYKYFHYPNKTEGSRDKNGKWIDSSIVFSNQKINYNPRDEANMMFFQFYNSGISNEIKKMSEEELLSKDWNYTKFIKRALKL